MSSQLSLNTDPGASELRGTIVRFLHTNEDSGWAVALVETEEDTIRAVGTFLGIQAGETLRLTGNWVEHPKFGRQLRVASFEPVEPASLDGIEAYLVSFVDGITKRLAKKIVRHFGEKTLDVLATEPDRLIEVHGIGKKRKRRIVESWQQVRQIREVMVFLQSYGLPAALAARIFRHFGDRTLDAVRADPYCLMEVRGVGFHKADEIARSRGIEPDSLRRIGAGAVHLLEQASARDGHMFVRRPLLRQRTQKLLASNAGREDAAIDELCRQRRLHAVDEAIFLRRLENAERTVAERLRALLAEAAEPLPVDVELAISKFEERERIVLAEAQRQTLREMVASKVMVLTGGPGTGKTTLTKGIVYVASLAGLTVALAAPTGRAAKRLAEATEVEAKTVHRLLGFTGEVFQHDENDPLEADLLVIDEASMLDAPLAAHLLRALQDAARLVIVGDVDQLPSVGPGRVLGDLIESGAMPVVRLTEIFRQAQKSLIVVNAHRVIHGQLPQRGEPDEADFFAAHRPDPAAALAEVTDLVARRITARYGFEPLRDVQVLAPMRRGLLGVENLNVALQERLNPRGETRKWSRRLRSGDRVMQTTNNYELEVFNGEIGTVVGFHSEDRKVLVDLEGRVVDYPTQNLEELELAYAVTIHKSQGSEFPCVVIVLHDQHRIMLQRNLFYTAITRGKQLVLVVGTRQAVATAVRTETTQRRETLLVERLQEGRLTSQ